MEVKEMVIMLGLVVVQMIYGVYVVVLDRVLAVGLNPLCLVIFSSFATSIMLLPFALAFERKKWPTRLRPVLIIQLCLIALVGVTVFQPLMLLGIKGTSPAVASAMPNLAPGFIFIIAACLRFEKFDITCKYSLVKTFGTLGCLGGAIAMSFLQSPLTSSSQPDLLGSTKDWIIGCFYLLVAVICISCTTILQAATMVGFPAPLSLCAITSLIGSILTVLFQVITERKLDIGPPTIGVINIATIVLMGGVVTSVCTSFQTWCVNQKGPVFVGIFSPIQTVFSAIISAVILKQIISVQSLAGLLLMFIGLYVVLWAKKKEEFRMRSVVDVGVRFPIHDVEKPLLS